MMRPTPRPISASDGAPPSVRRASLLRRITSAFAKFSNLAPKDQRDLICIFLALAVVALYLPVTGCGFVGYDDPAYTYQNPNVKYGLSAEGFWWGLTTLHGDIAYWHPLTWLSHQLDFQLFKSRPAAHHLTSVLLHAANTIWVFLIATRLTRGMSAGLIVALLFGIHPLRVESVAWLAERKDVLCAFFYFAAIYLYLRYADRPNFKRYVAVLACFICALASKPMAVTLPCVLLLLDGWPLRRFSAGGFLSFARPGGSRAFHEPQRRAGILPAPLGETDRRPVNLLALARSLGRRDPSSVALLRRVDACLTLAARRFLDRSPIHKLYLSFAEKLPLFALAAVVSLLAVKAQQDLKAVVPANMLPLQERLANAAVSYAAYIHKTFLPIRLSVHYSHPFVHPLWLVAVSAGFLALLTGMITRIRNAQPLCLVGWLWFLGTLVPTIGLIQVGSQAMADRYTYIPSVGFFLVLVSFGDLLPRLSRGTVLLIRTATAMSAVVLIFLTVRQLGYWKDSRSLFDHATTVDPTDVIAHNNVGKAYERLGEWAVATKHYQAAIEANLNAGLPRINLGNLVLFQGKAAFALPFYFESLLRDERSAHFAHSGLAEAFLELGNADAAVYHYREALRAKPSYHIAKIRLAEFLATFTDPRLRDNRRAIQLAAEVCEKTRHADPVFLEILAMTYAEDGQYDKAVEVAQMAVLKARKENLFGLENALQAKLTLYRQRNTSRQYPGDALPQAVGRQ